MSRRSNDGAGIILLIGAAFGLLWSLFKYPIPTIIGINLLTLIISPDNFGTVFGISVAIVLIYYFVKKSNKDSEQKEETQKIEEKFGPRVADQNKTIIDRNEDIIQKNLSNLHTDSWPYYVENKVRDCLIDIALAEGKKQFSPTHGEYLRNWSSRTGLPKEWLDMKDELLTQFKARFEELKHEQKKREEQAEREYQVKQDKEGQKFFEANKDLIDKFLEIAERKVSIIDDYGDENWDVLKEEIDACVIKIAKRNGANDEDIKDFLKKGYTWKLGEEFSWLKGKLEKTFKEFHEAQKAKPANGVEVKNLSGIEFEIWISKLLRENGFADVRGTPATGDQGADLIAKKDGRTIIIQAKRYQGTVGNKAVQEVISAVGFYGGDEGWVITNSTFTPSAKALANKMRVKLIDGRDLERFSEILEIEKKLMS